MRRAAMLIAVAGGLLRGCAEPPLPERSPEPPVPAREMAAGPSDAAGADAPACPANRFRMLLGKPIAVIDTAALPRPLRVYRAGHEVTADHRPERMNVVVGKDGRVARVRCG